MFEQTAEKVIPQYRVVTIADRPDLRHPADDAIDPEWPEFLAGDAVAWNNWNAIWDRWPAYQFVMLRESDDQVGETIMAIGNSMPMAWAGDAADLPDTGWDWALPQAIADDDAGRAPVTQCALSITVVSGFQGLGLSRLMVMAMRHIGQQHGLRQMIAPVRPSHKANYPLIPIDEYIAWQRADGLPFDPWLRVHARLGARLIKACSQSMTMRGTVAQWTNWTGMAFPGSGAHIIPRGLVPLQVDLEADRGIYEEPNVWMRHELGS